MRKLQKYKILIVILLTICLSDTGVFSQVFGLTVEQEAASQTARLKQELDLSPSQTKKIYEINLRYARIRHLQKNRNAEINLMKKKDKEIDSILTVDQKVKFKERRNVGEDKMHSGTFESTINSSYSFNDTLCIDSLGLLSS